MGAKLVIETQRSEPNDYGKIKVRLDIKPLGAEKVRDIENRVEDCLDALQEIVTGSKPTVAGAAAGKDKPVKGQRKLSLDKAGAVVETPSDKLTPAQVQAKMDEEDRQLREKNAKEDPTANPNRPVARPAEAFVPA